MLTHRFLLWMVSSRISKATHSMEEVVLQVQELCPLPAVANRVLALCSNTNSNQAQIAREVNNDPTLVTELLRIANSAVYGAPRQISEVSEAIGRVGLARLQNLVAALAMLAAYHSPSKLSASLHHRALLSGMIARTLAEQIKGANPDEAFICGLLCEVGALACLTVDTECYEAIRALSQDDMLRCEQLELEQYGFTCRALGAALLRRNSLPEIIAASIGADPDEQYLSFLSCVTMFARWAAGPLIRLGKNKERAKLSEDLVALATRARISADPATLTRIAMDAAARTVSELKRT